MELWLNNYTKDVRTLDHSSDITIGDASDWIKSNMDEYKKLRSNYSYSDLIKQLD